jgi:hypothetical protein
MRTLTYYGTIPTGTLTDKKMPLNEMMIISGGMYPWVDGKAEGT